MTSESQFESQSFPAAIPGAWRLLRIRVLALFVIALLCSRGSFAYSVLTHEEIAAPHIARDDA